MKPLDLIGATLTELGVSESGDEVMFSFLKEGEKTPTRLWIGHDEEGFLTIEMSNSNEQQEDSI